MNFNSALRATFVSENIKKTTTVRPNISVFNLKKKEYVDECVDAGKFSAFWALYCDYAYRQGGEATRHGGEATRHGALGIKQKHTEIVPIILKINERLNTTDLEKLVISVQKYIKASFVFDELSDNSSNCVVTASKTSTTIYFPMCRINALALAENYVYEINNALKKDNINNEVTVHEAGEDISLYGSTGEKYVTVYDEIDDFGVLTAVTPAYYEYEAHTKIEQELINPEELIKLKSESIGDVDDGLFWLPIILSLDYWRSTSDRVDMARKLDEQTKTAVVEYNITKLIAHDTEMDHDLMTLPMYMKFISMWDPNRIVSVLYWKLIGQAFYTLTEGTSRGLKGWVDIVKDALTKSRKRSYMSKFNIQRVCTAAYAGIRFDEIDVKTLGWYARIDSPIKYQQWHREWVTDALYASCSGTDADVGEAYYREHWLEYMCNAACIGRPVFYRYWRHKLVKDYSGISLRLRMSNSFIKLYYAMRSDVAGQQKKSDVNQATHDLAMERITKTIDRLKSHGFKRCLLSELSEKFHTPGLENYIDRDPELTLLKNGVLVADAVIHFRDGKPQDYLVKSFSASYKPEYTWDHPAVKAMMDWSFITFVDPETIKFHWKFLASLLRGGNNDKKVMFWSGKTGNNMKTTWQRLISAVLGEKCISMPINYFTMGKGAANGATPAEVRLEGARAMFSEEAEAEVPFLVSIIKSEVGNEKRQIRGLFQEGKDIIPQHKCIIVVNTIPPISKEGATIERVVITPFNSQVSMDASKYTREEQIAKRLFPRDPFFDMQIPFLEDAALWIMVNMYPTYKLEGIQNQPADVVKCVAEYWESTDRYNIFIKERIEKDIDQTIQGFDLYTQFSRWHEMSYKKLNIPDKLTAINEFTIRLGELMDGAWHGYRLNTN